MVRKKQVNNQNGAVLNRDFPRQGRSLIMVPEELRRLYPNAKPEYIEMALERFGTYECGEGEREIELFGKALAALEGWYVYILSSHTEFERAFGRTADKKRKLYNGMLKCDLFMYGSKLRAGK